MQPTQTARLAALLLLLLCAGTPAAASAAPRCFELAGERKASDSSSRRVTLATSLRPAAACEYALTPDGPFRALDETARGDADFASLVLALRSGSAPAKPQSIFARRPGDTRAGDPQLESVFLAGCSDYLLSDRAFSMRVPLDTQRPSVKRLAGADDRCGADGLALHFVALGDAATQTAELVRRGPWDATLAPDAQELTLEPGRFGVYAARAGSNAALLVGRIDTGSSHTPLRAALGAIAAGKPPAEPWLRARWSGGHMLLEPTSEALLESEIWLELRGAAAAGLAWLAEGEPQRALGKLALGPGGNAIHMPTEHVERRMRARYGDAARFMVPSMGDWRAMQRSLSLCVADSYAGGGAIAGAAPPPSTCVALSALRAPLSVRGGTAAASGQVCLKRRNWLIGADASLPGPEQGEECVTLATGARDEAERPIAMAAVGDQLTFAGPSAAGLYLCRDNTCEALVQPGTWLTLTKPGLWEVRSAEVPAQATSSQGLTLARVGVIDPRSQWHPVGLYDDDRHERAAAEAPPLDRWAPLEHDEEDVFAYVRSRHDLQFRLSVSPPLAAALDAQPGSGQRLRSQLPLVTRRVAGFETPAVAPLSVLVTRDPVCPVEAAGKLDEDALVDPDRLVTDQRFYVHLARYRGDEAPYRCIATAGMRVTESLSMPVSGRVRVGLLGDTQAMLFINRPAALGAALPLAYAQLRLPYGLGLDASASLTAAATFEEAAITRAGLGFSGTLFWGPPGLAPRLLSGGVMLHVATGTHRRKPTASLVAALNLSTLVDLMGGR